MIGLWMLVVTLCSPVTDQCENYIMEADVSYTDCQVAAIMYEQNEYLYSLSCERQE